MVLKKISFKDAIEFSKDLNKRTFFSNPFFLTENCLWDEKNREVIIYDNVKINEENPILLLPKNTPNITNETVVICFDEDIAEIEKTHNITEKTWLGYEYFYSTTEWIKLEGSKFRDIRKKISRFEKDHKVKILNKYPKEKIITFLNDWANEKRKKSTSELTKSLFELELKESVHNLKLLETYNHKAIFIEENGELLGFSIFFQFIDDLWISIMQKTKHEIIGLPQYLYYLKMKEISSDCILGTGAEAQDPNLKAFKESLRPVETKTLYTVKVGEEK